MKPFDELIRFEYLNGTTCYFVRPLKLGALVWEQVSHDECVCKRMDLTQVNQEILMLADIWSALNDSTQARIQNAQQAQEQEKNC